MVDFKQIRAVLPAVVQPRVCDLGELAGSHEAGCRREGVDGGGVAGPVGACWFVGGVEVRAVVEEALGVAVPGVGFYREGVGGVGGALVVAVDLGG